jgi:hypothetical protein
MTRSRLKGSGSYVWPALLVASLVVVVGGGTILTLRGRK